MSRGRWGYVLYALWTAEIWALEKQHGGAYREVQQFRISLAKLQKRLDVQRSTSAFLLADSNETSRIAEFESPRVNELLLKRNKCYWSEEKCPNVLTTFALHDMRTFGLPLISSRLRFNHTCIISVSKMNRVQWPTTTQLTSKASEVTLGFGCCCISGIVIKVLII